MKPLCSLFLLAALLAAPAAAQEERPAPDSSASDSSASDSSVAVVDTAAQVAAAREAATAWLGHLDDAAYERSWAQASEMFKEQLDQADWRARIEQVAAQTGSLQERTFAQTRYLTGEEASSLAAGEYVVVAYQSQFDTLDAAREAVVMTREGGDWKAAGYRVIPAQGDQQ